MFIKSASRLLDGGNLTIRNEIWLCPLKISRKERELPFTECHKLQCVRYSEIHINQLSNRYYLFFIVGETETQSDYIICAKSHSC